MCLSSREKGFTLVEVIIAIAIFGILSIPVLNLQINNIKINTASKEESISGDLAEERLEELKYIDINKMKFEEQVTNENEFEIITDVSVVDRKDITEQEKEEGINPNELYKLKVVVKKHDKVMQQLTTYRNSLERSD